MKTLYTSLIVMSAISFNTQAESMRCKGALIHIGDIKADIVAQCGQPEITDSFCRPVVQSAQIQATQSGENNVQNNIAVQTCEDVDVWTYHPAKGQFVTHLYFIAGELREMKYGDRIK